MTFDADSGNKTAAVVQVFEADAAGSIAWTVSLQDVESEPGPLWSPSFTVGYSVNEAIIATRSVWLPWDKAQCTSAPSLAAAGCCEATYCGGFGSPFSPVPATCMIQSAGTNSHNSLQMELNGFEYAYGSSASIPLVAVLDSESACPATWNSNSTASGTGIVLALAPAENIIQVASPTMYIRPTTSQDETSSFSFGVQFGPGYRLGGNSPPIVLRFNLFGSAACSRDVVRRYSSVLNPQFFQPPNANVHFRASGMGSYAATQGSLNQLVDGQPLINTLEAVGYKVNWDATFWWPYIMMLAPTIASNASNPGSNFSELWGSAFDKEPGFNNRLSGVRVQASYALRDKYYAQWQAANLTVSALSLHEQTSSCAGGCMEVTLVVMLGVGLFQWMGARPKHDRLPTCR